MIREVIEKQYIRYKISDSLFSRIAPWTTGDMVECNDGKTLETKVGKIDGISDSTKSNSSSICASSKAVYDLKKELTHSVDGVLTAGKTSVTIPDSEIKTTSLIDIYTSVFGVTPTNVAVSNGKVTLTFYAQSVDVNIRVMILNL